MLIVKKETQLFYKYIVTDIDIQKFKNLLTNRLILLSYDPMGLIRTVNVRKIWIEM